MESADLRAAWDDQAAAFVAWAREPNHDSYWLFHRDLFLELVPRPGRRTLDLGCGEGRLSRDLKALGHSEPPVPDPALRTDRGRRWRRVPMFLHLRAVKP